MPPARRSFRARHLAAAVSIAVLMSSGSAFAADPGIEVDPWEPINRKTFWVNDKLDRFLLDAARFLGLKSLEAFEPGFWSEDPVLRALSCRDVAPRGGEGEQR